MVWTPRKKAAAFSLSLLVVSVAFVVSAAAQTTTSVAPATDPDDHVLSERPLFRNAVVLAVVVTAEISERPMDVQAGEVSVFHASDAADAGAVATKSTHPAGRALFVLARGDYRVHVVWGNRSADHDVHLQASARTGVFFDAAGGDRWFDEDHRSLEKNGDDARLFVRIVDTSSGNRSRVEGATVTVTRDGHAIDAKTTDAAGDAIFQAPRGIYTVDVTWGAHHESMRVPLCGVTGLRVAFGEDATHDDHVTSCMHPRWHAAMRAGPHPNPSHEARPSVEH